MFFHLVSAAVKGDMIYLFTAVCLSELEDSCGFDKGIYFGMYWNQVTRAEIITDIDES